MELFPLLRFAGQFFINVFLLGFCQYLLLPGVVVLALLLLTGRLGRGYGVNRLIRHESPGKQFVVGIAFGILLIKTLFVGYLLETRRIGSMHSLQSLLGEYNSDLLQFGFWIYLAGIVLSFALPVVAAAAVLVVMNGLVKWRSLTHTARAAVLAPATAPVVPPKVPAWPLAAGLLSAVAGFVLLMLLVGWIGFLKDALDQLANIEFDRFQGIWVLGNYIETHDYLAEVRKWPTFPAVMALHGVAVCSTVVALVFYVVLVPLFRDRFSPAVPACFMLNVVVAAVGWLAFFLPGVPPFLVVMLLLLLALGGLPRYRIRFPNLNYASLQPLSGYAGTPTPAFLLASRDLPWARDGNRRPLVLVCASGGGIRAAAWTMAVLEQLETQFATRNIAFPYQVRLVTGASGGMVGAAYYVATLTTPDPHKPGQVNRADGLTLAQMVANTNKDSLSRLVYRLIYGDLPRIFTPVPFGGDRGRVLEEAWKQNLNGALDGTFATLQPGEAAGWRPSLVFSPMMIEDGRRLFLSNLDLSDITLNTGNVLGNTQAPLSLEALEFFRLFPGSVGQFKVSTAARMSASFPYFSPAAVLPTWPRRRVVDAGYYDNYGITVAAAWLFRYADWVKDNASRVILIQIRDQVTTAARLQPEGRDESTLLGRGLEWLTSPPDGALRAREWTMSFRNDEQLRVLTEYFDRTVGNLYFTTVAFEYRGDASLNWYLTQEEQASIQSEAARVRASREMADLLSIW
jgi:hypothetical protein